MGFIEKRVEWMHYLVGERGQVKDEIMWVL